jgi:hypothetical protein
MPQKAWSKKRERQYEHIKDGLEERGKPEDLAEVRRQINKQPQREPSSMNEVFDEQRA